MIYFFPKINRIIIILKTDIWKAAKLLPAQLLKLDINEQLSREVDYLKAENQVLKNQLKQSGKRMKFTDEQRRFLAIKAKALGKRLGEVVTIVRPENNFALAQKNLFLKSMIHQK